MTFFTSSFNLVNWMDNNSYTQDSLTHLLILFVTLPLLTITYIKYIFVFIIFINKITMKIEYHTRKIYFALYI